ncbi:MAG: UvrD-helicase domain-containing protein [Pseudomonadales bacterium]|nr:UvrD-helicase domain-containing protein [Pseudomonadales bacterium]
MQGLNHDQLAAVRYIDGPLLVLAGAGSGKTSVITRKISWLVETCEMSARHIAAVTFTNKAAREMRERAQKLLGESGRGLQISTFHQLGLRIIQRELALAGRKAGFSILDDQDSKALLKDLLLNDSDTAEELLDLCQAQISHWKGHATSPEQAAKTASNSQEQRIVELYARYQRALASYNAVDFDDLIALPVQILGGHAQALARWQQRIRYLLVDEYQDTNVGQYQLVQLLVGQRGGLCVVGDDDQSIYTWRGANPENLQQLSRDFAGLKVIKLEQNYRSTNRILRSANHLIANNAHLFEKKLWSDKGLGEPITAIQLANEEAEAEFVANEIIGSKMGSTQQFSDFAVLVRSNHQSKLLELKLQAKQVPYHVTGGTAFFARNEIKDVMAYLRVLVNPDDDTAFLRIVNVPRRKIGVSTLEALGNYAKQRECSLFSAIDEVGLEHSMPAANLQRLRKLAQWFRGIQRQIDNGSAMPALRELLDDIDYAGWLQQNSSSTAVAERRMENVHFLFASISQEITRQKSQAEQTAGSSGESAVLEAVIAKLLLRDLLDQQAEEEADNKVQVMTLHASKGLEFPTVFIMGFEEDILPHRNSVDADTVEEERRLAYVGMTRARRKLLLTMAKQRKQFGEMLNCKPSRFLDELPGDDLQRSGFGEKLSAEQNAERGRQALDSLKALFD